MSIIGILSISQSDTLNISEGKQKGSEEQLCFKGWESLPLHPPYSTTVIYKIMFSIVQNTVADISPFKLQRTKGDALLPHT